MVHEAMYLFFEYLYGDRDGCDFCCVRVKGESERTLTLWGGSHTQEHRTMGLP